MNRIRLRSDSEVCCKGEIENEVDCEIFNDNVAAPGIFPDLSSGVSPERSKECAKEKLRQEKYLLDFTSVF